jgi:thymidylate kinase
MNVIAIDGLSGIGKTSCIKRLVDEARNWINPVNSFHFYGHLTRSEFQVNRATQVEAISLHHVIFDDAMTSNAERVEAFARLLELAVSSTTELTARFGSGLVILDRSPLTTYAIATVLQAADSVMRRILESTLLCLGHSVVLLDSHPTIVRERSRLKIQTTQAWAFHRLIDGQLQTARDAFLRGMQMFTSAKVINATSDLPSVTEQVIAFAKETFGYGKVK